VEVAGLALSLSGATFAVVLRNVLVAVALGAVALDIFLRLSSHRAGRVEVPVPMPTWVRPVAIALSVVEVAALVEAVNSPVRFDDAGFEYMHWALAAIALVAAYALQVRLLRSVGRKSRALESP
jgi:hypothetical protein